MHQFILTVSFMTALVHVAPVHGEIEVERDRFSGNVVVRTKPHAILDARQHLFLLAMKDKGELHIVIKLVSTHDTWAYLSCHATYWLIDGKPLALPHPEHNGAAQTGYVIEQLDIYGANISQIESLAKAKKVEFKTCNDEFSLTPWEMEDLRIFHQKITDLNTWK